MISVRKTSNAKELLEKVCLRPRQVRYQAALRPDSSSTKIADCRFQMLIDCQFSNESAICHLKSAVSVRATYLDFFENEFDSER